MIELMDLTAVAVYLLCAFYYCWQWWKADRAIEKLQKSSSEQSEKIKELENHIDFLRFNHNNLTKILILLAKEQGIEINAIERGEDATTH